MEGAALLEREARFRQMNLELERRTQSLLRHVECAVQKQDTFAEITAADIVSLHEHSSRKSRKCDPPLPTNDNAGKQPQATYKTQKNKNSKADSTGSVPNLSTQQNVCCCLASPAGSEGNTGREFLEAFVSVSVQDNVLPKSFVKEPPNVESICKFLASKVRLLQGQVDKLQALIDKKAAQCEQHLRAVAELEGGRLKLIHSADNLRAQSERHAGRARSLALQLQECERRYTECRGERDRLEVELKRAQGACASAVARRAPLEQAARAQQQQLAARDAADKEFRESCRAQAASQAQALAALEKRNKTLLVALDKQQQLTENLRCQRRLLAAELGAGRLHKEYCELLEAGRL